MLCTCNSLSIDPHQQNSASDSEKTFIKREGGERNDYDNEMDVVGAEIGRIQSHYPSSNVDERKDSVPHLIEISMEFRWTQKRLWRRLRRFEHLKEHSELSKFYAEAVDCHTMVSIILRRRFDEKSRKTALREEDRWPNDKSRWFSLKFNSCRSFWICIF